MGTLFCSRGVRTMTSDPPVARIANGEHPLYNSPLLRWRHSAAGDRTPVLPGVRLASRSADSSSSASPH